MNNIKKYIESINLPYRGGCPSCGGANTFIANEKDGFILYYCFRASCNLRGKIDHEVVIDGLRNSHNIISNNSNTFEKYAIPAFFISPLQNNRCYSFLHRYNLIDFYSKHVNLIRYDPKQDRCVFLLLDKGECYGAVGRYLSISNNPRWFVYGRYNGAVFSVPILASRRKYDESYALLVEDCVSACVASNYFNSIALLGTNIPDESVKYLIRYDKLYLALDDDATGKAIKLQKQLNYYRPTFIVPLKKDIKYYSSFELETLRKELDNG
jgi:hypothetical protein